jgi:thioredoxin reductase (NADPH)
VNPVILIVAADADSRAHVLDELARYQRDYRLEVAADVQELQDRMEQLVAANEQIAMVAADLAAGAAGGSDGVDVLAAARRTSRTTRCVLLLDWGLRGDQRPAVERAMALGVVDTVLTKPTGPRDEDFHTAIGEDLAEWAWTVAPVVEAVKIVGERNGRSREIHHVLDRLGVPSGIHEPGSPEGQTILARAGTAAASPVVEVMGTTVLANPTNRQLAEAFGVAVDVSAEVFDVAVVGAGPAGLGAAVYAASEGLSTLVLEGDAFGGQAGTSSMIRNYLGFPRGITGRQLGRRAVLQSASFGARFDLARSVTGLVPGRPHQLTLEDGAVALAHAVVLACGVTYRRLGVEPLEALVGHGVFYGASVAQARSLQGGDVIVVGAGNSGGQAAVHLARFASHVTIVARGPSLAATMSSYLIAEIESSDRIAVRTSAEIVDGGGDAHLQWVDLADRESGQRERIEADGLFILIGTETRTGWLPPEIQRDDHGFVLTGDALGRESWPLDRRPLDLETSVPGVFAAGDVRANDVKRVAAAVGEGSITVPMIHRYLAELRGR